MTVNAITDTKKGRTGIAPTYLHTTHDLKVSQQCQSACTTAMRILGIINRTIVFRVSDIHGLSAVRFRIFFELSHNERTRGHTLKLHKKLS